MGSIGYRLGNDLNLDQVIELYSASTLCERRPVDDRQIMAEMIRHANLVVTAWDGELLIGIARTVTDFSYVGYLADLAVRASHQRRDIGIGLIRKTREKMGRRSMLVLLAAPKRRIITRGSVSPGMPAPGSYAPRSRSSLIRR